MLRQVRCPQSSTPEVWLTATNMKRVLAALIIAFLPLQAFAMTTPILLMNSLSNINTISSVSTRDFSLLPNGGNSGNAGVVAQLPMPISGTFSNLMFSLPTNLTSGTYVFTVFKNGSATALTCTVTVGNSTCNDFVDSVAVVAGTDVVSTRISVTGTPDLYGTAYGGVSFQGTTAGESFVAGTSQGLPSNTSLFFGNLGYGIGTNATEIAKTVVFPTNGTLDQLQVKTSNTPNGVGNSWIFTLRRGVNGGAMATTSLTCTVTNTATTCNDLTDIVTVAPGDLLSIAIQGTATERLAVNGGVSFRFKPDIDGESVMMAMTNSTQTSSADRFLFTGGVPGNQGNEASTSSEAPVSFTWKKLYVNFDTAPSAGKSRAMISRLGSTYGSLSDQGLKCTVADTNTTCNDTTNSVNVGQGQLIDWDTRPAGTPTASTQIRTSAVMFIPTAHSFVQSLGQLYINGFEFHL